jgi:uncharacterized protein involved in exopolysaccharide biosynthesis
MNSTKYTEEHRNDHRASNDEIDLMELLSNLWLNRKTIYKTTIVSFCIGLFIAFGSKIEYEASCKLLPEIQEGSRPNLGGLGSLAGLAGINLDMMNSQGSLRPEIYPQIVSSAPFLISLVHEELNFSLYQVSISSSNFFKEIDKPSILGYIKKYTLGLPSIIRNSLRSSSDGDLETESHGDFSDLIVLSKEDNELLEDFAKRISVAVDKKNGVISIKTEMPDPRAAAELADKCVKLLQNRVVEYKLTKALENRDFIKERLAEAEVKFLNAQKKLAIFNDRNVNVITSIARAEEQRLQNEYSIAFEVYKGLATQIEQAEIKLREETPVFTILEPVMVPVEKSSPKRGFLVTLFTLLGAIVGIVILTLKVKIQ